MKWDKGNVPLQEPINKRENRKEIRLKAEWINGIRTVIQKDKPWPLPCPTIHRLFIFTDEIQIYFFLHARNVTFVSNTNT